MPGAQSEQAAAPPAGAKLPAAQDVHWRKEPVAALYEPAAHSVQLVALAARAKEPGAQSVQEEAPALDALPFAQALQDTPSEAVPAGHSEQ